MLKRVEVAHVMHLRNTNSSCSSDKITFGMLGFVRTFLAMTGTDDAVSEEDEADDAAVDSETDWGAGRDTGKS